MDRNNSHLSGEYFVVAELYRREFSVGLTMGNAKAIDILAYKNKKSIAIQVKAIRNKKSVGWPMMRDKIIKEIIYVFVNLNGTDEPEYYICTSEEAKAKVKQYQTRGIIDLNTLRDKQYQSRWDKLEL